MKYIACLFLLLSACAQPDYIDPKSPDSVQTDPSHAQCPLALPNSGLCADVQWSLGPQSPAESEFTLKFWNNTDSSSGPFVDPANNLSVILWMPSMGHGSSPVTIEKIETGVYRVRRVFFIMPGDWEIRISLKNGTSAIDQATVSLVL
ncbi:FixH family protein [Bdellovibrio sp. HCB274]|uniref:FixH family protein n=1 Tax=Bdellovibrio sp. HCB274 TaxID=3394361 RepID=UPI0039B52767